MAKLTEADRDRMMQRLIKEGIPEDQAYKATRNGPAKAGLTSAQKTVFNAIKKVMRPAPKRYQPSNDSIRNKQRHKQATKRTGRNLGRHEEAKHTLGIIQDERHRSRYDDPDEDRQDPFWRPTGVRHQRVRQDLADENARNEWQARRRGQYIPDGATRQGIAGQTKAKEIRADWKRRGSHHRVGGH